MTFSEADKKFGKERVEAFCLALLGSELVESNSHEDQPDGSPLAYMTADETFYFVYDLSDPVVTQPRIGKPGAPIPGRYHVGVEVVKRTPGNHSEPDEFDLMEIGREESLDKAIALAAHRLLEWKIDSVGESLFWEKERKMEPYQKL